MRHGARSYAEGFSVSMSPRLLLTNPRGERRRHWVAALPCETVAALPCETVAALPCETVAALPCETVACAPCEAVACAPCGAGADAPCERQQSRCMVQRSVPQRAEGERSAASVSERSAQDSDRFAISLPTRHISRHANSPRGHPHHLRRRRSRRKSRH